MWNWKLNIVVHSSGQSTLISFLISCSDAENHIGYSDFDVLVSSILHIDLFLDWLSSYTKYGIGNPILLFLVPGQFILICFFIVCFRIENIT